MKQTWAAVMVLTLAWAGGVAAAVQDPLELVQKTSEEILGKVREERAAIDNNPRRLYQLVNEIVLPHFDFERMSRWVLGKYWRRASPQQRRRFVAEFRSLLVRTYAKSLAEYTDNKIEYLPLRRRPGAEEVTVRTEVEQAGGFPIPIDYSLYLQGGSWKVFDVVIDGVSLVTNYRSTFASEVRRGGLDKLIADLADRNQRESGRGG
ncbi:MAG TPA: ABC transporter substrate-binding protein [Gammaproteobacteria bacterium]|nr:ABC transporter substrate-binding protein [Gammaproteobacteria bacterium]